MAKLIMFYGKECPHCKKMHLVVDKLEKETKVSFEKLEVWHNEKNADMMRSFRDIISPKCGGQLRVPAFINTETKDVMCGEVEYNALKKWAAK